MPMTENSFLLKGAIGILTGLSGDEARARGDILVRNGVIAEIGDVRLHKDEPVIDASGTVITPGLVNTHHHLFQGVLKAVPAGMNDALARWLRLVPYQYWDKLDENAMRVGVTIGMAELALSGCTTISDHHYIYSDHFDFDPNEILFEIAEQFGIRFVLCRGGATKTRTFDDDNTTPMPTETLDQMLDAVTQAASRWHDASGDAMHKVVMAPTTPTYSVESAELKEIAATARALGLRIHSHLSENSDYVHYTQSLYHKRPVQWMADHDWLGPDVWFAHLVKCDTEEVALLAQSGTGMAHCPQANARLASGIAPADQLHQLGGTVSLAVDGAAANEAADMISAMYAAFTHHRAAKASLNIDAETVLQWASSGGAKTLGLDAVGTLEVGKQADISLFELDSPRYFGQHDRMISPIISGGDARIRRSFVAGNTIVNQAQLDWLDMEKLAHDAQAVVKGLMQ